MVVVVQQALRPQATRMAALVPIQPPTLSVAQAAVVVDSVPPRPAGAVALAAIPAAVVAVALLHSARLHLAQAAKAATATFASSHSSEVQHAKAISSQS